MRDLTPVPASPTGDFCALTSDRELIVEVKNVGTGIAAPSTTLVKFATGSSTATATPALAPGASHQFKVPLPEFCHQPDCHFEITADDGNVVVESDETNNVKNGFCLG